MTQRAIGLCRRALRHDSHRHSPHTYIQPQMAACTLLGFYLRLSYRDAEPWLLAKQSECALGSLGCLRRLGAARIPCDHKAFDYLDHFGRPFKLRIVTGTLDQL